LFLCGKFLIGELIFEILGAYSFENFGVILDLGVGSLVQLMGC
jgi:hypothetical protein